MEITDKWLMEMGGWQAMKTARALWNAGAVSGAALDGQRLTGTVRDAGKDQASGLLIKGRSDVEPLCQCFLARRDGILCAHSLAVGIAWAHRHEKQPQSAAAAARLGNTPGAPAAKPAPPVAQATGPLTFLLNPAFFDGLRKHRLSVIVEQGAPDPAAQSADSRVVRWLGSLLQKTVPPHLMLGEPRQTTDLLQAIAGHPRIFLKDGAKRLPLTLSPEPARLPLHAAPGAEGNVRLSLTAPPGADLAPPAAAGGTGWLWRREERALAPVRVPEGAFEILQTLPPGRPLEKPRRWLARHLGALQEFFQLELPESLTFRLMPGAPRFELLLEGSLERLTARLRCRYENGPAPFPPGAPDMDAFPLESPDSPDRFLTRNLPAEAAALRRLTAAGFQDGEPGELLLKGENAVLQFFAGELERLKAVWDVTLGTRFAAASAKVERLAPKWTAVGSGTDWLAFDLAFAGSGGTTFDRVEIARLLATGSGHKKLPNGRTAVVSLADAMDLNEVLRDVRPDQESGHFRVKRTQLGYLEQTFGRATEDGLTPPPPPVPAEIAGLLRDYQKTGVDWLLAQAGQGSGGILADEMGLGKTLQSLAAIAALRALHPDKPALVVCPKSLLGNWAEEAARFVPGLKVLTLEGTRRANRFADIPAAAIVITSYQLLARDIDHHRGVEWGAVFLDEAGFIRNPETQAAKAACELRADVRFALTGTPIENGVRDLWSLMRFAVPGYLGPRDDFRERYEAPLTAGGAPAVMARLRRRMAPYILRRLKEEVAKDLPSKIEKILTCPLTDTQRGLYTGLMREGAAKVQDAESAKQKNQARLHMLTTLLRLRQTCCDPRLLGADLPKKAKDEALSGKLEALAELLEEIRDGGHSVIIFSAFASMLRLLKETVDAARLGWCHIDGQTNDRAAQVAAFRDDPDKRVFLISLKAGGFGLNLTKADTVIHFDPWWNPAVEAQATDRAHRIGQSRPVTVYKLITAGTVEEKILALQRKKRGLMDAALDDEAPMMDGLTDDDLRSMVLG